MTEDTNNPKPHIRHYSEDDKARLRQLVNEGIAVKQEIETLSEGLNDTIKAIAEEMEIKPGMLKRVINVAYKRNLGDARAEFEELEDIITTLGLE